MHPHARSTALYSCEECGADECSVCSACRSFYYCGREHQRKGHQVHKRVCATFRALAQGGSDDKQYNNNNSNNNNTNSSNNNKNSNNNDSFPFQAFEGSTSSSRRDLLTSQVLNEFSAMHSERPTKAEHGQIFKFLYRQCGLRSCSTHRSVGKRLAAKMIPCPSCRCVGYCCKEHLEENKELHTAECDRLAIGAASARLLRCDLQELEADNVCKFTLGIFNSRPLVVCGSSRGALAARDFQQFAVEEEVRVASAAFGVDFFLRLHELSHFSAELQALVADALSGPLTALHALREGLDSMDEGRLLPGRGAGDSFDTLEVHLIGAELSEWWSAGVFEELLHRLDCKVLRLRLVGPQLAVPGNAATEEQVPVCPQCSADGKSLHITHYCMPYEAFLAHCTSLPTPFLRLALNAGLFSADVSAVINDTSASGQQAPWSKALQAIAKLEDQVPLVVTGYNLQESERNAGVLREHGFDCGVEPSLSPFGSPLIWCDPLSSSSERCHSPNGSFIVAFPGNRQPETQLQ
ncbi:unnamed protein product [Polarella glacialis]|uniref:MYND-type domain-containing protein n=1 Tax=Polarella glacialis TaxID=89957 RepID=A0A813EUQ6_POLGL|nr:unnamed protein product [Polarella glacialis]